MHGVAISGDEQIVQDFVVARAELRVVGLLPEAHIVPRLRPENIVADDAPPHAGEVRARAETVVEIVAVDEEIVARAAPALAFPGIGVALRVVERDAVLAARRGRVGIDLKVTRDIAVGLVEADDVPVAAPTDIDAVAVALFGTVGDIALPDIPIRLT